MGYQDNIPKGIQFAEPIESPNKLASVDAHYGPYNSLQDATDAMTAYGKPGRIFGVKGPKGTIDAYVWQGSATGGTPIGPKDYLINGVNILPSLQLSLESQFGKWQFTGSLFSLSEPKDNRLVYRVSTTGNTRWMYLETNVQDPTKYFRVNDNSIFYGKETGEHVNITQSSIDFANGSVVFSNHLDIYNVNGLYRFRNMQIKENDSSFSYVVLSDKLGNLAMKSAQEIGKNMANANLVLTEPRKHTGAEMELAMPVDLSGSKNKMSLPDKKLDMSYSDIVGRHPTTRELGTVGGKSVINSMLELDKEDPLLLSLFYKLNGNFQSSSRASVLAIFPPILEENTGVHKVRLVGTGLLLPEDERITTVEIIHLDTLNFYKVGYENDTANTLKVFFDTGLYPKGTYKIRIVSGVQAHISTETIELKIQGSTTNVDVSKLEWTTVKRPGSSQVQNGIIKIAPNVMKVSGEWGLDPSFINNYYKEIIFLKTTMFSPTDNFSIEMDIVYSGQHYTGSQISEASTVNTVGLISEAALSGQSLKIPFDGLGTTRNGYIDYNGPFTKTIGRYWWEQNIRIFNASTTSNIVGRSEWQGDYTWKTSIIITKNNGTLYVTTNGFNTKIVVGHVDAYRLFMSLGNTAGTRSYDSISINRIIKF